MGQIKREFEECVSTKEFFDAYEESILKWANSLRNKLVKHKTKTKKYAKT